MIKSIQLQIPEPCHESWDKMTPDDKGRFCNSCRKTVIDFTGMSDTQLIAFFKKSSTGPLCGRFIQDQLERDIAIPRKRIPWLKYFFRFTIPVFLTSLKSTAQGGVVLKEKVTQSVCNKTSENITVGQISMPEKEKLLTGKVVNEEGIGIPYATVMIKGTKQGTSTDSTGSFRIMCPPGMEKPVLSASCIGYVPVETNIDIYQDSLNKVILTAAPFLGGEVVIVSQKNTRKGGIRFMENKQVSVIQKISNFFLGDAVNVYPNPAKPGGNLNIRFNRTIEEGCRIELINLQGQLIQSIFSESKTGNTVFSFRLPATTPGLYLVRITNTKSGKQYTEKINIQ